MKKPAEASEIARLNNSFRQLITDHQFMRAIEQGQQILDETSSSRVKRLVLHFMGCAYVHLGAFNKAKSLFNRAILNYGENVMLLRDLACCLYQLGEIDLWRVTYRKVQAYLSEYGHILSQESVLTTRLIVGKFLDEEGLAVEAEEIFVGGIELIKNIEDSAERNRFYYAYLPQILKLHAHFRHSEIERLGQYYNQLISLMPDQTSREMSIEIEHSLMLAELGLVGPKIAWARAERMLQDMQIQTPDKNLVLYDFIEESLHQNFKLPARIFEYCQQFPPITSFEKSILALVDPDFSPYHLRDIQNIIPNLPWSQYLRVLILHLMFEKDPLLVQELNNKIRLILAGFSERSRHLWFQRMNRFSLGDKTMIRFVPHLRSLSYRNKMIDLSRKKGMVLLLSELSQKQALEVDEAINLLWSSTYSPENYHRLRMTVHRLNQILYELTEIPKIIEVSADKVALKPSVKLQSNTQESPSH